jgi:hypothetical protein
VIGGSHHCACRQRRTESLRCLAPGFAVVLGLPRGPHHDGHRKGPKTCSRRDAIAPGAGGGKAGGHRDGQRNNRPDHVLVVEMVDANQREREREQRSGRPDRSSKQRAFALGTIAASHQQPNAIAGKHRCSSGSEQRQRGLKPHEEDRGDRDDTRDEVDFCDPSSRAIGSLHQGQRQQRYANRRGHPKGR